MPTVLDAAGLGIPNTVEGSSLKPWVQGEPPDWRDYVHGEHSGFSTACQFVTDGEEKFHWETVSGTERFFDLTLDPQELHDLSGDPATQDRVALWRQRLVDVLAERPEDGMSDGEKLIPGQSTPAVRPHLMEKKLDCDGVVRPRE
jgi:arylsulfatase A-like enzyme